MNEKSGTNAHPDWFAIDADGKPYRAAELSAKLQGLIPSIKPLIKRIKQTDFRISPDIEIEALKKAQE